MAVELTKVALWIETVEPGKPLGFLDANIRLGDSLLGIFSLDALRKGIPDAAYKQLTGDDKAVAKDYEKRNRADKGQLTRTFDFSGRADQRFELPPLGDAYRAFRQLPEDTVAEIEAKRDRFYTTTHDPRLENLAQAADLYIAAFLTPKAPQQTLDPRTGLIPTTEDVWTALRAGTVYGPRLGAARQLASTARAFHWPLEFPDIMNAGGFEIILGNPPWERIKLQEQEFFAAREPEIAEAPNAAARGRLIAQLKAAPPESREGLLHAEFEITKRTAEASSVFARVPAEDAGRFPLTGRGDVNTYALFAELFSSLTATTGRAGLIVPTGIATDSTTAPFFASLVETNRIISLHDFQTGMGYFDRIGHARYKFCLITTGYTRDHTGKIDFSFFSRTADEFLDPRRHFRLDSADIVRVNPNTNTVPIFRTQADADLTARIYNRLPVLINETVENGNPWGVSFMAMLHMANDSGLFMTADDFGKLSSATRDGSQWIVHPPTLQSSEKAGRYLPLYEAKLIHHFDHRWATYDGLDSRDTTPPEHRDPRFEVTARYWIHEGDVTSRLSEREWNHQWLLGWRDICRATDERTVISSVFPLGCAGNTMPLFFTKEPPVLVAAFVGNLASMAFDFVARQKIGGTHLTYGYLTQLPILPPDAYVDAHLEFLVPRVLELTYTSYSMTLFARDLGFEGEPFPWEEDRRALLRAELDAWYARAYGLSREELRYVLDPADVMGPDYPSETFRVLKKNEIAKFKEFRTQRLVLDAWDRMERGELHKPDPYQRPAAGTPPTAVVASLRPGAMNQPSLQFTGADPE
jgi:hypothetical protein